MKKMLLLLAAVALAAAVAPAKDKTITGTIVSESSVPCGSQAKRHKQMNLLCQEYVVRTDTTEYHVRQAQPYHAALVPVNTQIEFKLDKDKMKFRVDSKEHDLIVVSETAIAPQ